MLTSPVTPSESNELLDQASIRKLFPELRELLILARHLGAHARVEVLGHAKQGDHSFPLVGIIFGPTDVTTPVVGFFGGVHGLERIGTKVLTAYLGTLAELVRWDAQFLEVLKTTRLMLMPLVNPMGMFMNRRSNGNGVDIMRNSPVDAPGISKWHLHSGHRMSSKLPWYRGEKGKLEVETETVFNWVKREIFSASVALTVDVHSGYGNIDRFWFPYAKGHVPMPHLAEAYAVKSLLDRSYPNHVYRIEPQSSEYVTHGDVWDYLYEEYRAQNPKGIYLPFCLELGSWLWIKKDLGQIFSRLGAFNPRRPHRVRRILRRHLILFDFLMRIVHSPDSWANLDAIRRERFEEQALKLWYGR